MEIDSWLCTLNAYIHDVIKVKQTQIRTCILYIVDECIFTIQHGMLMTQKNGIKKKYSVKVFYRKNKRTIS